MMKLQLNSKKAPFIGAVGAPVAKKMKRKGVKLRKNALIRGIRVKDAESKRKIREILAAEENMKEIAGDERIGDTMHE